MEIQVYHILLKRPYLSGILISILVRIFFIDRVTKFTYALFISRIMNYYYLKGITTDNIEVKFRQRKKEVDTLKYTKAQW